MLNSFDKSVGRSEVRKSPATVAPLTSDDQRAALDFLARRPRNTVIMSGWIRDHGIVSARHQGTFFGCRDRAGQLTGVALVGKHTLFEVCDQTALSAFAQCARDCAEVRMVMAEDRSLNKFWRGFAGEEKVARLRCREILVEKKQSSFMGATPERLRLATIDDSHQVVEAHAQMVLSETGIDPRTTDPEGFRRRCVARINQRRVWVLSRDSQLIFKVDVISDTPEAIYIEGLWVAEAHRGKGLGKSCLAGLCSQLLHSTNSICCFVDAGDHAAKALYRKSGFAFTETYSKFYL